MESTQQPKRRAVVHNLYEGEGGQMQVGDVLLCGEYRHTQSWIVGEDYTLVRNPDYSNSGYLSIPLQITKLFDNAVEHYADIIEEDETTLKLHGSNKWIVKEYGKTFPEEWKIYLTFYGSNDPESGPFINFGNGFKKRFGNESHEQIMEYHRSRNEVFTSFLGWYNINGKEEVQAFHRFTKENKLVLPPCWDALEGSGGFGSNHTDMCISFCGPKKHLNRALQVVKEYYPAIKIRMGEKDNYIVKASGSTGLACYNFDGTEKSDKEIHSMRAKLGSPGGSNISIPTFIHEELILGKEENPKSSGSSLESSKSSKYWSFREFDPEVMRIVRETYNDDLSLKDCT